MQGPRPLTTVTLHLNVFQTAHTGIAEPVIDLLFFVNVYGVYSILQCCSPAEPSVHTTIHPLPVLSEYSTGDHK